MGEITTAAYTEAIARFAADIDSVADWLVGQCFGQSSVNTERVLRPTHTLAEATTPELVQVAVFASHGATPDDRIHALDLIRSRYAAHHTAYLARLAAEAAESAS